MFTSLSSFSNTSSSSCDITKLDQDIEHNNEEIIIDNETNENKETDTDANELSVSVNNSVQEHRRKNPFSIDSLLEKKTDDCDDTVSKLKNS